MQVSLSFSAKDGDFSAFLGKNGKGQPSPPNENEADAGITMPVDYLPFAARYPLHRVVQQFLLVWR